MNKWSFTYCLFFLLMGTSVMGQVTIQGRTIDNLGQPIVGAEIFVPDPGILSVTDADGNFELQLRDSSNFQIIVYSFEYETVERSFVFKQMEVPLIIELAPLSETLTAVEISARRKELFALRRLNETEGTAIYSGKKTEVILLDEITGNLATNQSRQVYAQVAGLNIYENNDAGLQLNIGGRGLDPNRTSNFNTRQNGYDISADVLGYPESYYTPPAEGISEIQVVRGAASLQYGTQFGGLLNFKLKRPSPSKKINLDLRQTIGSYGLNTTFAQIDGTAGKWGYLGWYNRKSGGEYRANNSFDSDNAYGYLEYALSSRTKISAEYTYQYYLAQQAGGLTDRQFERDPTQSNRTRNYFRINWNLFSSSLEHKFSDNLRISLRSWALNAGRDAVGFRGNPIDLNSNPITAIDESPNGSFIFPRDVISDDFQNWGVEFRSLYQYRWNGNDLSFLIGAKYFKAENKSRQGPGSRDRDADFTIYTSDFPDYANQSSFIFPNKNLALFAEHIFKFGKHLSLTPGIRFENINTASDGNYQQVNFDNAGNPINSVVLSDQRELSRSFFLIGLGASYRKSNYEIYANISENYRSVTFSDIRVVNPTFIVDPDITDEKGWTYDLGIRGRIDKWLNYDGGIFGVYYDNRIGIILDDRANRVRKNIGTAFIYGMESFVEWNITKFLDPLHTEKLFSVFSNISLTRSRYLSSEENNVAGNEVEFIPDVNVRLGIKSGYKNLIASLLYSHIGKQWTDAENSQAALEGDARSGIIGDIPSYGILDFSVSYQYGRFTFDTGILNLLDRSYFTRRATGYPGPGIIPSPGRNIYLTVGIKI